jgi:hypothetical protein
MTTPHPKSFWIAQLEWLASLGADLPNSRKLGIERAREAGASDTEIASALKISRQAVAKAVPR